MVQTQDSGWVILDKRCEVYYCGYKKWDKQLRKAKIYHSTKYANETMDILNLQGRCVILPVELHIIGGY